MFSALLHMRAACHEESPVCVKANVSTLLLKFIGPALLLGPNVRMRVGVVLEIFEVGIDKLLLAKGADGGWFRGFFRSSVGVDGDAGAGGLGFFVLALYTGFLADGHSEDV